MRSNPAVRISEYEIAGLVASAFNQVSRMDIAVNGFRCTCIHPFDRNVFSDSDFIDSHMTDVTENESKSEPLLPPSWLPDSTPSTSAQSDFKAALAEISPVPDASKIRATA